MKRHINIIFILIILNFENGISQLYIGPNLGIYTSRLIDPDLINQNFNIAHSINNKFKTNSLFAGMQFEYKFNNNFFLNISVDYTKMNVEATSSGFVPIKAIKFDYYSQTNLLGYNVSGLKIGFGFGINFITNSKIHYLKNSNVVEKFYYNFHGSKLIYSLEYEINQFTISLKYHSGIHYNKREVENLYFKPISSLGFSLGYLFKMPKINFNPINRLECPKF